jgi:hypothetical protein
LSSGAAREKKHCPLNRVTSALLFYILIKKILQSQMMIVQGIFIKTRQRPCQDTLTIPSKKYGFHDKGQNYNNSWEALIKISFSEIFSLGRNSAEPYFFRRDRAFDPFGKFPIKSDRVLSVHSVL